MITPPNAVLSSAGFKQPVIVVLDSMKTEGDKTTFTFHSAKHNQTDVIVGELVDNKNLTNVVVTIDNKRGPDCTTDATLQCPAVILTQGKLSEFMGDGGESQYQ
jgi:hypothetical protein